MLLLLVHGPYFENSCSQVKLLRLEWADLCPGEMEFGRPSGQGPGGRGWGPAFLSSSR